MMVRLREMENARSPDSASTLPEPDRALIAEGLAQGLEGLDLLLWGYERNFDPTLLAENLLSEGMPSRFGWGSRARGHRRVTHLREAQLWRTSCVLVAGEKRWI
ncbi:hypothetical protein [Candidatus Amarolinea dominans]|uniref:hypothetical protein n=1 Tax=Candidatus Amarolinea dominans TaxID=3140696 RepID=UPI003136E86B|nr:hypothetical protein [Anaerolineae bacterium]